VVCIKTQLSKAPCAPARIYVELPYSELAHNVSYVVYLHCAIHKMLSSFIHRSRRIGDRSRRSRTRKGIKEMGLFGGQDYQSFNACLYNLSCPSRCSLPLYIGSAGGCPAAQQLLLHPGPGSSPMSRTTTHIFCRSSKMSLVLAISATGTK
jgi:hypothetical protein